MDCVSKGVSKVLLFEAKLASQIGFQAARLHRQGYHWRASIWQSLRLQKQQGMCSLSQRMVQLDAGQEFMQTHPCSPNTPLSGKSDLSWRRLTKIACRPVKHDPKRFGWNRSDAAWRPVKNRGNVEGQHISLLIFGIWHPLDKGVSGNSMGSVQNTAMRGVLPSLNDILSFKLPHVRGLGSSFFYTWRRVRWIQSLTLRSGRSFIGQSSSAAQLCTNWDITIFAYMISHNNRQKWASERSALSISGHSWSSQWHECE